MNRITEIREEITSLEQKIEGLKSEIREIRKNCPHEWVDDSPLVNLAEYSETCTKCGEWRTV